MEVAFVLMKLSVLIICLICADVNAHVTFNGMSVYLGVGGDPSIIRRCFSASSRLNSWLGVARCI